MRPLNAGVGRQLAAEYLESHPNASLRQVARAVGISAGTVRDVRARLSRGESPTPTEGAGQRSAKPKPLVSRTESTDARPILSALSRDPAFRMSVGGRRLLRWLSVHVVNPLDSSHIAQAVPDHCFEQLIQLALRCSNNWTLLAEELARVSSDRMAAEIDA